MEYEDNQEYQKLRQNFEIRLGKFQNRLKTQISTSTSTIELLLIKMIKEVKGSNGDESVISH